MPQGSRPRRQGHSCGGEVTLTTLGVSCPRYFVQAIVPYWKVIWRTCSSLAPQADILIIRCRETMRPGSSLSTPSRPAETGRSVGAQPPPVRVVMEVNKYIKNILRGAVVILCIILCLYITTATSLLRVLWHPEPEPPIESLADGTLLPRLAMTSGLWNHFPAIVTYPEAITDLFQLQALIILALPLVVIFYFFRLKKKWDLFYVGFLCLPSGIIPYYYGVWVLSRNPDPSIIAPWLRVMWIGLMYGIFVCGIFSGISIFKSK